MANCTEDGLDKLLKDLISIILSQQRKIDQDNIGWLDKIRKLNDNFSKSEADVKITKNINNLLSQRVVDLERQCWANAQYSRRECLEVVGIPRSVDDNSVEEKIIKVFEKVSCNIDSSNIEVCHRITQRNDRVNVRFSRRKDCQRKLSVKKILQKLKMEGIGLAGDNKVFINHSLCPYYRVLWSKTKVLFSMGKINRLMVSNRTVKAKISEIRAPISITHSDGFTKYFPDIDLSDDFENFCNNFELTLDAVLPTNPFLIHSIGDFNAK